MQPGPEGEVGLAWVRLAESTADASGTGHEWRLFRDPVEVVQTWSLGEVGDCLARVEAAVDTGLTAVGLVSYEAAAGLDPRLPSRPADDFPLVWFGLYEGCTGVGAPPQSPYLVGRWTSTTSPADYGAALDRIRAEIAAGSTYQVNHTLRLSARFEGDSLGFFADLARAQPTPYAAYLDLGRYRVCSVSPELFVRVRDRTVTTRPMKGTVARGATPADDADRARWLAAPGKNRAENVMIVDLLRNDLGRVAVTGSVRVPGLCRVETLPTALTMTSTVEATLLPEVGLRELLTAVFPCGSVTGAPKVSTMRLIRDLEPEPRRVYCGALGIVEPSGDLLFNVPIRTVLIDTHTATATYGVGGGITWDSDVDDEYAETRTKAAVLSQASPPFDLLETMLLERCPEGWTYRNLAEHLARLRASAEHWSYGLDEALLQARLDQAAAAIGDGRWRCRVLLSAAGDVEVQLVALAETPVVTAVLAESPVRSWDPRLRHKTTRREVYGERTVGLPAGTEALLRNERGELTEFTTGTLVVELDGGRFTPPESCGLLPGIGRMLTLRDGTIEERVLSPADLGRATAIWHLNSLRGWRAVQLNHGHATGQDE